MGSDIDWLRQYIAFAEPQLERVIVGAKLHATLTGVVRGPMTLTFQMRLQPQSMGKATLDRFLNLGDVFAGVLDTEMVRMQRVNGTINLEVPLPSSVCMTPTGLVLAKHTNTTNVCIGIDANKQPVQLDLKQHGAILWVGPTRSGKTQSMKSVIYAMLAAGDPIQFAILSQKTEDWEPFIAVPNCLGLASRADDVLAVGAWAEALLDERAQSKVKTPRILLVADDLINLLQIAPAMGSALGAIASMGAGLGMHLLIGTQEAGSKRGTGDNSVENNVTARVMYRIANAQAAARSAGQGDVGVSGLSGNKGDALLLCHGSKTRIATGFLKDDWLAKLPMQTVVPVVSPWAMPVLANRSTRSMENAQNEPKLPKTSQNEQNEPKRVGGEYTDRDHGSPNVTPTPPRSAERSGLPLPPNRPPTAEERQLLRQLFVELKSKEKVYAAAWGFKNGKTFGWLTEALAENTILVSEPIAQPVTATSTTTLSALLNEGNINWDATRKANQR